MSSNKDQYHKFWANDDNHAYLESLPKGSKGTVINQALRYYANLSSFSGNTIGIDLESNVHNHTTPRSVQPMAMLDSSTLGSITTTSSPSNVPLTYTAANAADTVSAMATTTYQSTPANPMLCPNGHLWMNGTQRCVNPKCTFGGNK